jgi:uncharacterized protein YndB with AHSA1/START domain
MIMDSTYNKLPDIVRTITIDGSIEKVWSAISTSEALAAWLMPNDFQPLLGHEFTFKSQPQRGWDGVCYCKVTELNPPNKLGFTWQGNNMDQHVSFELKKLNDSSTEFTLVHSGWSEEHAVIREVMYDGWGYILEDFKNKIGDKNDKLIN